MRQRSGALKSFQRVVGGGVGLFISLLIGSSLIITAQTAQSLSYPQEETGVISAVSSGLQTQALEPGQAVERQLENGESHLYRLSLEAGQYLRVVVDQRGINVVVTLYGPNALKIVESDWSNTGSGREPASLIAEAAGDYRLEVSAPGQSPAVGRYEVKIEELRAATTQDTDRVAAERATTEAVRLEREGTPAARRKAIEKQKEALSFHKVTGDREGEANALASIGYLYSGLDKKQQAIDYLNQALPFVRDRERRAWLLNSIGHLNNNLGDKQQALAAFQQALLLWQELGNKGLEAGMLTKIGNVCGALCEEWQTVEYFDRALKIQRELGDQRGKSITLYSLGAHYDAVGEKQKAIDCYLQALPLLPAAQDRLSVANTLYNLGTIYDLLGARSQAVECYRQALAIRKETKDPSGEANAFRMISNLHDGLGERQEAITFGRQALALYQAAEDRSGEASMLRNIGMIYEALGERRQALEYFDQAAPMLKLGNRRFYARLLTNIGKIRCELGERERALDSLREALPILRSFSERYFELHALYWIARAERDLGNLGAARARIEEALEAIERLRTTVNIPDLRASGFARAQDYYELEIDLLMRLHKENPGAGLAASALEASERSRARELLEMLASARAEIRQGVDPALLEREIALRNRVEAKADLLMRLLGDKRTAEQAEAVRKEHEALKSEHQRLLAQIRERSPRYAALTQPQPLTLAEIQQKALDAGTLLLEYALGEERSYLWAVTKTSITAHELPCRQEIEQAALHVRDLLAARNRSVRFEEPSERHARIARTDAEYPKAAAALSHMLLGPVAGQLEKKRLLIVGDGALQYVSFAALPKPETERQRDGEKVGQRERGTERLKDGETEGGNPRPNISPSLRLSIAPSLRPSVSPSLRHSVPLIVDHEIVSLPSASALAMLRRELAGRKPAPKAVAILADPVFELGDERLKTNIVSRGTKPSVDTQTLVAKPLLESDLTRSVRDLGLGDEGFRLPRLPFTRREARAILSLAPADQRLVALDFAANQAAATSEELAQYRYIHFATHGLLNPKHPELSGIVLSLFDDQGAERDGFLRAHEIFNLNLQAELVVLSGCQTGLGKDVRGEGLVGLTRGFMYAGAARVLVSLWDVDDQATSELMGRLYRGMLGKKQLAPAAALREAQVALWREKRWRAPYYWAGFTLQGEPR